MLKDRMVSGQNKRSNIALDAQMLRTHVFLQIPPHGQKIKKENKTLSGSYRHCCLHRCSVFWMSVTTLLCVLKASDDEFNFYIDNRKGPTCKYIRFYCMTLQFYD